jgi:hypothetical protein
MHAPGALGLNVKLGVGRLGVAGTTVSRKRISSWVDTASDPSLARRVTLTMRAFGARVTKFFGRSTNRPVVSPDSCEVRGGGWMAHLFARVKSFPASPAVSRVLSLWQQTPAPIQNDSGLHVVTEGHRMEQDARFCRTLRPADSVRLSPCGGFTAGLGRRSAWARVLANAYTVALAISFPLPWRRGDETLADP